MNRVKQKKKRKWKRNMRPDSLSILILGLCAINGAEEFQKKLMSLKNNKKKWIPLVLNSAAVTVQMSYLQYIFETFFVFSFKI